MMQSVIQVVGAVVFVGAGVLMALSAVWPLVAAGSHDAKARAAQPPVARRRNRHGRRVQKAGG